MRRSGSSGSGPRRSVARDVRDRARRRYLRLTVRQRLLSGGCLVALAAVAAGIAGWPILLTAVFVAVLLAVGAVTMPAARSASGSATGLTTGPAAGAMATLAVVICWLAAVVPLGWLFSAPDSVSESAPDPAAGYQPVLLAVLAVPVAALAHRIRGYVPWRSALPALAVAGVLAAATASWWPALWVAPAWVAAFGVLGYRWLQARRTFAPEAYESGWAQENEEHQHRQPDGDHPDAGGVHTGAGSGDDSGADSGADPDTGTSTDPGTGTRAAPAAPDRHGGRRGAGSPAHPPAFGAGPPPGPVRSPGATAHGVPGTAATPAGRPPAVPDIAVDDVLAELEGMIGLDPVKEQIRSIAASIEAAKLRAQAGMPSDTPLQHFVFVGPPGTGKTTVARIIARIFCAYGLLPTANVVEAQRADLVGEYLGATAPRTNHLVDGALDGVLFIDEAYSLVNAAEGHPDRFGNEAVQALLKRAEDDRDRLVIVLAGYEPQMEQFLSSNPGLSSRFGTRVRFPGYRTEELVRIAEHLADRRGDRFAAEATPVLRRGFDELDRRGVIDELGNGRLVRTLVEAAARARDVRVVGAEREPTAEELGTVRPEDVDRAFAEATERYRGYTAAPTLDEALGTLDRLVGLDPVKQQVHAIAAQLRVARLRQEQGLRVQPPMRHFVFAGPPGTGKTTVARVLGHVFAALGLLSRPEVVEAQRADLVGDHLGATALKTNRLIDTALGGVLFVDEAYALHNPGYAGGDAFGAEAVQALLKRAEDDRERLVVVLAGYRHEMDRFLASNPGLASRFASRVDFPSYRPDELLRLAELFAEQAGDRWEAGALDDLAGIFQRVCGRGLADELGNGRFVRSLYERACAARDVRVAELGSEVTTEDLTTVTREDTRAACRELIPSVLRRP